MKGKKGRLELMGFVFVWCLSVGEKFTNFSLEYRQMLEIAQYRPTRRVECETQRKMAPHNVLPISIPIGPLPFRNFKVLRYLRTSNLERRDAVTRHIEISPRKNRMRRAR